MYELKHTRQRTNPLEGTVRARGHRIVGDHIGVAKNEQRHYIVAIVTAVVAAVAAGTSMYMASEAQQEQAKQQRHMADWQQEVEKQQADAARKQVQLRAQRHLNQQAAKAAGAGVVADEGSLLVDQMEAASMSQYEEDLAAYGHELNSKTHGFESKLFKQRGDSIRANEGFSVGLSALAAGAGSYGGSFRGGSGSTVATQKTAPAQSNYGSEG